MFLFSLLISCSFLVSFETGSHFVALALLELARQSWMASKRGLPASTPSASTMHHHTQLCLFSRALFIYFLEPHAQAQTLVPTSYSGVLTAPFQDQDF